MALNQNIVILVGGVGGAKLAYGLAQVVPPEQLTVIVNVADDFWHYGLRICPDSDTIMYTLSGLVDKTNGWGIGGDTTAMLDALKRYGESGWFRLGDQDLATHLLRTQMLHDGKRITDITHHLAMQLGVNCALLPVTDAEVATMVDTVEHGELDFQTYFVRHRWQPTVKGVRLHGLEAAMITPEVTAAIANADVILFGPSNPWLSIEPILAIPGVRAALLARDIPRVAVTPIIGGEAVKGPAAKMMPELGYPEVSPQAVAAFYGDVINGFVADARDVAPGISTLRWTNFDTMMVDDANKAALARRILAWLKEWGTK